MMRIRIKNKGQVENNVPGDEVLIVKQLRPAEGFLAPLDPGHCSPLAHPRCHFLLQTK